MDRINYIDPILSGEAALRVALQDSEITKQQLPDTLCCIYGDRVTEPVDSKEHVALYKKCTLQICCIWDSYKQTFKNCK